jgi:hypothetical protein
MTHAWLFPSTDIGPTLATGINDYGWVCGYSKYRKIKNRSSQVRSLVSVTGGRGAEIVSCDFDWIRARLTKEQG